MSSGYIAIIGERDLAKPAHRGIEASFALARTPSSGMTDYVWVGTAALTPETVAGKLAACSAIWCAPGSPYENTAGALLSIQYARLAGKAFLGTCGGFQHALMEFAQNVLHHAAAHEELTPDAPDPLITRLSCSLIGTKGKIIATRPEFFSDLLGARESVEEFNCNYGVSHSLAGLFQGTDLVFVAHDEQGQERAFRLVSHPFFVGTLFQPERRALNGQLHPLVSAFVAAAANGSSRAEAGNPEV